MKTYKLTKDVIPSHATHPGIFIKDEIEYRKIKQSILAKAMGIAPTVLSEIIHGKRNLTPELSLKLEKALDIDAAIWMKLQVKFEIDSLRIKARNMNPKAKRALPYTYKTSQPAIVGEPKVKYEAKKKN